MLFTSLTKGMCFCINFVVTPNLTPWNVAIPYTPKQTSFFATFVLFIPPKSRRLCTIIHVKLLKVAPSITCNCRFNKIGILLQYSTTYRFGRHKNTQVLSLSSCELLHNTSSFNAQIEKLAFSSHNFKTKIPNEDKN